MLTLFVILSLSALVLAILAAVRPSWPVLWVAVVLLALIECLRALPLGRIVLVGFAVKAIVSAGIAVAMNILLFHGPWIFAVSSATS